MLIMSFLQLFKIYFKVVILSGDFNSCSVNNGYEPLTYRAVKQHALGLRSVYNEDVPNSLDSPTSQNIYTNWKWRYRPKAKIDEDGPKEEYEVRSTLDYIFYSPFKRRTVSPKSSNTEPLVAVSGSQIGIAVLLRFTGTVQMLYLLFLLILYINFHSFVFHFFRQSYLSYKKRPTHTLFCSIVYFFGALFPFSSLLSTEVRVEVWLGVRC